MNLGQVNSMWEKQLQLARDYWKFAPPYQKYGKRDLGAPDNRSPLVWGWKPTKMKGKRVPYHFENLDRISRKHGISAQDWCPVKNLECPNCGARGVWKHPGYEKFTCERCTAEFY